MGADPFHAHQAIVSRPGAFQGKGTITEQKLDDQGHGPECIAFRKCPVIGRFVASSSDGQATLKVRAFQGNWPASWNIRD